MRTAGILTMLAILLVLTVSNAFADDPRQRDRDYRWEPRHMWPTDPDYGPSVSSPPVRITPRGDRESKYPPYFQNDR